MKKETFKMKRQILIALILAAVVLIFASCGNDNAKTSDTQETGLSQETAASVQETENGGDESEENAQTETKDAETEDNTVNNDVNAKAKLLYQGHGSLRITTSEGKVIYIDPYAGEGYDAAADLILITHNHSDHTGTYLIKKKNPECKTVNSILSLEGGKHNTFDLGFVTVEAVEAGYNANHHVTQCVGYVLTLSDGVSVYVTGDTSKTPQMSVLAEKQIDYAFFCCDGIYNMGTEEASECASLVGAKHSIPYHTAPGQLFDATVAEKFSSSGRMIVSPGQEIELEKD